MTAWFALLLWLVQTPGGLIEGSVVRAGTNPPLPLINARVELSVGRQTLVTRTDGRGQFAFGGLATGSYRLSVARDGYIRQVYGQRTESSAGASVQIGPGQRVDNILFELQPAPTISGSIQDATNRPLTDIIVQALKISYDAVGTRHLTALASARTDDRGQYRLYWLDSGDYFVQAVAPPPAEPSKTKVAYAATYFPGFPDIDNARQVRLDLGREASGIDFTLTQTIITSVSGRVIRALTNDPVVARVRLTPTGTSGVHLYEAVSGADGTFLFSGVLPGSYVVSGSSALGEPLTAFSRVQVRDFDPKIVLEIGPGITLEGQVFLTEGESVDPKGITVSLLPLDDFLPPAVAEVDSEGRVSWSGIQPGKYVTDASGLPLDLYLGDARFGAEDPLNKPIEVRYSKTPHPPLQMLLAANGGSLSGAVFDRDDKPLAGGLITLVPTVAAGYQVHNYRVSRSDANGTFLIRGIPPGDYDLYAWESIEPRAWLNMDFLRLYEHLSLRLEIKSGENPRVSIHSIQP